MKRLFTIHHVRGRVLLTKQLLSVIEAIRFEYGQVELRPHKSGVGVYVPSWKA